MKVHLVFILVLTASPCLRGIIKTSNHNDTSNIVKATVDLVTYCYENKVNVIGLAGNSRGTLIKTLQTSMSTAVTLLDGTRRIVSHDPLVKKRGPSKLQVFVVTASSPADLEKILRMLKNSVWWNHMASVFTLFRPPESENGCAAAFEILYVAWKINLLNTKLICLDITQEILIYTYNPYIGVAPDSWEVENTYKGENDHPWTLLVHEYRRDIKICKDLDFDKTRNLGGFGIHSSVKNIYHEKPNNITACRSERLGLTDLAIPIIIFCALNGTLKLLLYNSSTEYNFMDDNGRDIRMDTVEGISDILWNVRYTIGMDIKTAYPRVYAGLCVSTQYNGQLSQLDKIRSVVDTSSRYCIIFVILITLLFFIFVLRQSIPVAMLNILRIICNGSVPIVATSFALRLYLGCLFIFVVTVQALYQGKMATLLTKPVFLDNVNTMQDLIDGNQKVYSYKTLMPFFLPVFEGRFYKTEEVDCIDNVVQDSSAACVIDCASAIEKSRALKLFLSKDPIIKATMSYVIRDDWPLESRVNKILGTLFETNIIWYWCYAGKKFDDTLDIHEFYEKEEESHHFRTITLNDLSFAFVILGAGLICSVICCVAEIEKDKIQLKTTKIRSYSRNSLLHKNKKLT